MGEPTDNASSSARVAVDEERLRNVYGVKVRLYKRLAINLHQALVSFLDEADIAYHSVDYRVKKFESFLEKVPRKGYIDDPFIQCEDLCGLRIICYYPSDVDRVCAILGENFDVAEVQNKATQLGVQEFGYRSHHTVVTVKEGWLAAPNYRGLSGLRAEIQVRTLLMHAWAEIEHKLAYKSAIEVPDEFRRKLSRLSAKFEEADEQFESLRQGLSQYRVKLETNIQATGEFASTVDLNIESIRAFLNVHFPERSRASVKDIREVLHELEPFNVTMRELTEYHRLAHDLFDDYEIKTQRKQGYFGQIGALRGLLDIALDGYMKSRVSKSMYQSWAKSKQAYWDAIKARRSSDERD